MKIIDYTIWFVPKRSEFDAGRRSVATKMLAILDRHGADIYRLMMVR